MLTAPQLLKVAKTIAEDSDVLIETPTKRRRRKRKSFRGLSTSSFTKAIVTRQFEEWSPGLSGKGLCVYLVGDAKSGLDRHVIEKTRLGFTDLTKHVIVEIEADAALDLAQMCQEKYPDITVICGDIHAICQKLGYNNIEHIDFDGTEHFGSTYVNLTKSATDAGVSNIHLVGAIRGRIKGAPEAKKGSKFWAPRIRDQLNIQDLSPTYTYNYLGYSSGPTKPKEVRSVRLKLRDQKTIAGNIDNEDYNNIIKFYTQGWHGKPQTDGEFIIHATTKSGGDAQVAMFSDIEKLWDAGTPMFGAMLQSKSPTSYRGSAVNTGNFIKVPEFDSFYAENARNLSEIKFSLPELPDHEFQPRHGSAPKGGKKCKKCNLPLEDPIHGSEEILDKPKPEPESEPDETEQMRQQLQKWAPLSKLGIVKPARSSNILCPVGDCEGIWPNPQTRTQVKKLQTVLAQHFEAFHPENQAEARALTKQVREIDVELKYQADFDKAVQEREQFSEGLTRMLCVLTEDTAEDFFKFNHPSRRPNPLYAQSLSHKGWDKYQKDKPEIRKTKQDIPKIMGKDAPLPEPDWAEVAKMLAADEINPDEAYEVGLTVEEIENILGRPLTELELESIRDVDEN